MDIIIQNWVLTIGSDTLFMFFVWIVIIAFFGTIFDRFL